MQTLDTLEVYIRVKTYDHLSCALDEEYISENKYLELKLKYEHLLKLINGYISYLKRRKQED